MTQFRHTLYCNRTGVPLGSLDLTVTAGHVPYMSHWHEMVCYHPLFSLGPQKLIEFMTREWECLGKDVVNETSSENEEKLLRVGFVALLHNLGSIQQDRDAIGLPSISTVQSNLESLIALSTWKHWLDSKRFTFPQLHISRLNDNAALETVHDYLEACWAKKREYDAGISDLLEQERIHAAERAVLAIRNNWFKPKSKKVLWKWLQAILPQRYKNDLWIGQIFCGNNAEDITMWDRDEIEFWEEILQGAMPNNNATINHAVRERIKEVWNIWNEHYRTFTIEQEGLDFIAELKETMKDDPEPKPEQYPTRGQFLVARAKWQLAHPTN